MEDTKKESLKAQLKEMGFDDELVGRALEACPGEGITIEHVITAMENLDKNKDGDVVGVALDNERSEKERKEDEEDNKEPLEVRKQRMEERIAQRRKEREEEEKAKEREMEMKRRQDGQEIGKTREELQTRERIRVAEEMRKEKLEAKMQKEAILREIEKDRAERRSKDVGLASPIVKPLVTTQSSFTPTADCKCVIAIRLSDGSQVQQEFDSKESLAAVRTFAMLKANVLGDQQVTLQMPPGKPFDEDDMSKPLHLLGLCPRARLQMRVK